MQIMQRTKSSIKTVIGSSLAALLLATGCGDDFSFDLPIDDDIDQPDDDSAGGGDDADLPMDGSPVKFMVTLENAHPYYWYASSGMFNTPEGAEEVGPLTSGSSYSFTFFAHAGHYLSFATMFIPSNDLFYAPTGSGIPLFDEEGAPVSGDVTDQVFLWDAGTEINQEPGIGADQPQQSGGTGEADPTPEVRLADDEFGNIPDIAAVIQVALTYEMVNGAYQFTATITNVSAEDTLNGNAAVPVSPGVYVVHTDPYPLFTAGEADVGEGLEAIAEEGAPAILAEYLASNSGVNRIASPGVWAVVKDPNILFTRDTEDRDYGLEAIAEDGDPSWLAEFLAEHESVSYSGIFNTPVEANEPGPLLPGASYSFEIMGYYGDHLSLATMLVPTNDWFISEVGGAGIPLFNEDGEPVYGDMSEMLRVYDLGTEVDQEFGYGFDQPMSQEVPDTGDADENPLVRGIELEHSFRLMIEVVEESEDN